MPLLTDSRIDLGRKGMVWLEGQAVPVERTGAERAVARMVSTETETAPVVATLFGEECGHEPSAHGTLAAGGRRKKDALQAIDRWYRREARERIELVVANESHRLDLHPEKVTIRDQKTRWGSCSTSGTLSFNWRLVIGPHHALRYVVIHELVHIEHHNHSRKFWNALSEALPDWKRSAQWLRSNERALTAYRPKI
ncbi:MAG: M48 family metallopeptidase [Solirubrobacterales bacterium]